LPTIRRVAPGPYAALRSASPTQSDEPATREPAPGNLVRLFSERFRLSFLYCAPPQGGATWQFYPLRIYLASCLHSQFREFCGVGANHHDILLSQQSLLIYRDKTSPAGTVPGIGPVPSPPRFAISVFSYTSMYCLADLSQEKS